MWESNVATFPRTEADVADLATRMISGLPDQAETFPSPPVSVAELEAVLSAFWQADGAARGAAVAATQRYAEKEELLQKLKDLLRSNIRYAEGRARHDPDKLRGIGWGPRRRKREPRVPGQVLGLEVVEEGTDWVTLRWKRPTDGGAVGAYKVQMQKPKGAWTLVESTANNELRLEKLERGITLAFKVVAINKVGESIDSSTVTAAL
jgi:hypothetical protein